MESMKKGGILYVFPLFHTAPAEQKIRHPPADDLLRGSLGALPLDDNNAVVNLCCSLCTAYERKAFLDGIQYGAHLVLELYK